MLFSFIWKNWVRQVKLFLSILFNFSMYFIFVIDIIEGKCVCLIQGDYDCKKVYNEDLLEVVKVYEVYGLQCLYLVDFDGVKVKQIVNYKVLEMLVMKINLYIDFGGGLKLDEDLRIVFDSGVK